MLLQEVLTEEDWRIYNEYVRLHEALTKIANTLLVFQQSFCHGFYRILYFLQPTIMGLSAYCDSTDLNTEHYRKKCEDQLLLIEKGLKTIWSSFVLEPMKALYRYDLTLDLVSKLCGFDLAAFRPRIAEYEAEIKDIQGEMKSLVETINTYKKKTRGEENRIDISPKIIRMLQGLSEGRLTDLLPQQDVCDKIASLINDKSGIDRYLVDKILQIP